MIKKLRFSKYLYKLGEKRDNSYLSFRLVGPLNVDMFNI
ncbi:hypothetical protein PLUTE_b1293 [Pseudoalteromonas luteoviolacea DSM 6061]|nr:hypothetical protein [Pseudoalteromonas luteoviolacea DSM 6061]